MNSICCRRMQRKPFQSSDNIVEAISKKKAFAMDIILKLKQWKIEIYFKINQIPKNHIIAIVNIKSLSLN